MFFIFGTKNREKEISSGSFYCPHCRTTRMYKHIQVGQYFSLYFIPIFRIKELGEFIVCQSCQHNFQLQVLSYKPPLEKTLSAAERLVLSVRKELEEGMPLHMMIRKLQSQKVDQLTSEQLVQQAIDGHKIACAECGFEYIDGVKRCLNCDRELTANE